MNETPTRKRKPRASVRLREALKKGTIGHVAPSAAAVPEEPRFGIGVSWPLGGEGICGSVVRTVDGWQGYPLTEPTTWDRLLTEVIPAEQWRNIRQTDLLSGGVAMQRAFRAVRFGNHAHVWRYPIDPTETRTGPLMRRADQRCGTASRALDPTTASSAMLEHLTVEVKQAEDAQQWIRMRISDPANSVIEIIRPLEDMAELGRALLAFSGYDQQATGMQTTLWWLAEESVEESIASDLIDSRIKISAKNGWSYPGSHLWGVIRQATAGVFSDPDSPGAPNYAGEPIPLDVCGLRLSLTEPFCGPEGYQRWRSQHSGGRWMRERSVRVTSESGSVDITPEEALDLVSVLGLIALQLEDASKSRRGEAAYL